MIANNGTSTPVRALLTAWAALALLQSDSDERDGWAGLKVFVDGDKWLEDVIQSEDDFVTFVNDRRDADVCVRATPAPALGKARHYQVQFIGVGRFELIEASAGLRLEGPPTMFSRRLPAYADSKTRHRVEVHP